MICIDVLVVGKVVLFFGGGSGYELMYCGYIGQGMFFGVCLGEIFILLMLDKMFECVM